MTDRKISEFSLGPGVLYIGRGRIPEAKLETYDCKAGDTADGLRLTYEYDTRELYDVDGNIAGIVRYGEKVKLQGELCRIITETFESLMKRESLRGGASELTVLLVCPLPAGESFRLYLRGVVPAGFTFKLCHGGTMGFELVCGKGAEHPVFCLNGQTATERRGA